MTFDNLTIHENAEHDWYFTFAIRCLTGKNVDNKPCFKIFVTCLLKIKKNSLSTIISTAKLRGQAWEISLR